jgi:uncharacterized membrane protein HdeD (DUF308 family)
MLPPLLLAAIFAIFSYGMASVVALIVLGSAVLIVGLCFAEHVEAKAVDKV